MQLLCTAEPAGLHRPQQAAAEAPQQKVQRPQLAPPPAAANGRRALLAGAAAVPLAALLARPGPALAIAAEPVLAADSLLDSVFSSMVAPEVVAFPRRRLDFTFAVLLMRSGYEAVDDLDFIPMDLYQKNFWKLRAAEYQPYTLQLSPILTKQGDLGDPNYFDFISFAQYATTSREIPEGRQTFREYCEECEDMSQLVTRNPAWQDNALLPGLHAKFTGDHIYDGLVNGFRGVQFGGPQPCSPGCSFEQLLAGVQAVLDVFIERGFAIRATVSNATPDASGQGGTFRVRLEGPANLWGLQMLASRRSLVYNSYDALAVQAYLRASGRSGRYKLSWTDTAVTEDWVVV